MPWIGHRSDQALERDIRTWLAHWNEQPRPFVWRKTANEILDKVAAYCHRISDSGHLHPVDDRSQDRVVPDGVSTGLLTRGAKVRAGPMRRLKPCGRAECRGVGDVHSGGVCSGIPRRGSDGRGPGSLGSRAHFVLVVRVGCFGSGRSGHPARGTMATDVLAASLRPMPPASTWARPSGGSRTAGHCPSVM